MAELLDLPTLIERRPEDCGWRWLDGTQTTWTFAELGARVGGAVAALRTRGVTPGTHLAVIGGNTPEWVILREAARLLGAVFVPISPRLTPAERAELVADAGAHALAAPELAAPNAGIDAWTPVVNAPAQPLPTAAAAPAARLLYTSGSQGTPKGVLRDGANDAVRLHQTIATYGLRASDVHLVAGPLYHSGPALFYLAYRNLGAEQWLLEKFDAEAVAERIASGHVDSVFLVPTMWRLVAAAMQRRKLRGRLRIAWSAGEPLDRPTRDQLLALLGDGVLWTFYGATETGTVTILPPEKQRSHGDTVGFAAPGVELQIVDPESDTPLPPETPGRIYVRTPQRMRGYHAGRGRQPPAALTHADALSVGDRGYLTPDGALVLLGREGGMIISGGINIYPETVEQALRRLPEVREAIVFGVPDPKWGQAVAALIEPAVRPAPTATMLKAQLRRHLAGYKLPKYWGIGTLPRAATGKLLRDPQVLQARLHSDGD